ncbi:MAG: hypothetical protein FP814_09080 [Desulfobacterium sp.]|nr:hypothetical protein [Desulfobacteraceae bacterium]MBA3036632.1 hypothetical protein [Desulfobacterium sp.]
MKGFLRILLLGILLGIVLTSSGCGGGGDSINPPDALAPTDVVQPLAFPGPYAVACTNIAQDFSQIPADGDVNDYWEGRGSYVTDLLEDPDNTLIASVTAPMDSTLYGSFTGDEIEVAVIVCYPTTADNPRPDYQLPTGEVVPHMQTGLDLPLFADDSESYPVIVFSHGYGNSPISSEAYFTALSSLASHGYVVIAPFHGDFRFSDLKIDNIGDSIDIASNLDDFTAMQALRPLAISAALTLVLEDPQWQGHLDETRIGGFGASMGGETMMLLDGASLTTSYFDIGASSKQVTTDLRIKAAVGYVPYFGQAILPAFGRNQQGLDNVTLPFLGISGTADTVAPISEVETGMSRLTGTRELISLEGVEHGFDVASTNDIFTWALMFLDAELNGNQATKTQLSTMASVAGGGDDRVVVFYNGL